MTYILAFFAGLILGWALKPDRQSGDVDRLWGQLNQSSYWSAFWKAECGKRDRDVIEMAQQAQQAVEHAALWKRRARRAERIVEDDGDQWKRGNG